MSETHTYILFMVAGTTYGVRSEQVLHMEMVEHITPVPNSPPAVEGVVLSRGQVVPVINLRARFGFERMPLDLKTRLLVVQDEVRRVALLADEAREFISIPDAAIQPPHESVRGTSGQYVDGIATLGDRMVMILNSREVIDVTPSAAA